MVGNHRFLFPRFFLGLLEVKHDVDTCFFGDVVKAQVMKGSKKQCVGVAMVTWNKPKIG